MPLGAAGRTTALAGWTVFEAPSRALGAAAARVVPLVITLGAAAVDALFLAGATGMTDPEGDRGVALAPVTTPLYERTPGAVPGTFGLTCTAAPRS